MQFQHVQFTFSLQFPITNTLNSIHVMVQKYHNTVHSWPLICLQKQVAKLGTDCSTFGLYCVTITWQQIFKGSLQVAAISILLPVTVEQTHNQGLQGGEPPLENFSPPLEKCVGHNFKILYIVQKIWAPLGKLFAPPSVPSWLRACCWTQASWQVMQRDSDCW